MMTRGHHACGALCTMRAYVSCAPPFRFLEIVCSKMYAHMKRASNGIIFSAPLCKSHTWASMRTPFFFFVRVCVLCTHDVPHVGTHKRHTHAHLNMWSYLHWLCTLLLCAQQSAFLIFIATAPACTRIYLCFTYRLLCAASHSHANSNLVLFCWLFCGFRLVYEKQAFDDLYRVECCRMECSLSF